METEDVLSASLGVALTPGRVGVAHASYRPAILGALPPMRRTRERDDVTAFFAAV